MITGRMIDALLEHDVQIPGLEDCGPEPCLRALILNYYLPHFDLDRAGELTEEYIRHLTTYAVLEL